MDGYSVGKEDWSFCGDGAKMAWTIAAAGALRGHGSPAHRRAVLVACLCARTASRHWDDQAACERSVDLAERWAWGDGEVSREDLRAAGRLVADPAVAAALAAAVYPDGYAADCGWGYAAADAALMAASAVADAAVPAPAGDATLYSAQYSAAWSAARSELADLIRAAVPEAPL
jgi:hypothetical protein